MLTLPVALLSSETGAPHLLPPFQPPERDNSITVSKPKPPAGDAGLVFLATTETPKASQIWKKWRHREVKRLVHGGEEANPPEA